MGTLSLPNALIAVDTNFPLDLADGKEDVLDALSVIRRRLKEGRLLLTPTAFQELVFLADRLVNRQLIPAEEYNDARILAEAALLGCDVLLSSDAHLHGAVFDDLKNELARFDVNAPIITTPRTVVRRFF